jgi:hypothetical protein
MFYMNWMQRLLVAAGFCAAALVLGAWALSA